MPEDDSPEEVKATKLNMSQHIQGYTAVPAALPAPELAGIGSGPRSALPS